MTASVSLRLLNVGQFPQIQMSPDVVCFLIAAMGALLSCRATPSPRSVVFTDCPSMITTLGPWCPPGCDTRLLAYNARRRSIRSGWPSIFWSSSEEKIRKSRNHLDVDDIVYREIGFHLFSLPRHRNPCNSARPKGMHLAPGVYGRGFGLGRCRRSGFWA
jgi:hypothetical protein